MFNGLGGMYAALVESRFMVTIIFHDNGWNAELLII